MLWDMEGASGILRREQTWVWEEGVRPDVAEEGFRLLEADVNSAVRAALDAGADEVIVCDTHRGGGNLRAANVLKDPRVTYEFSSRGWKGREYRLMPGLDGTVDAFLAPGHHAKDGTPGAFLPHTSNLTWKDFVINGQSVGEMGLEACFAAHWNIPFIFAQGDRAARLEAEAQFPGIVFAEVKRAVSHDECRGPEAGEARRITAEKVAEAVTQLRAGRPFRPFRPALPMTVRLRTSTAEYAETVAKRPGVTRVEERLVECRVGRHADVFAWLNGSGLDMPPPEPPRP